MTAYKLDELARAAEISSRTVRYYVQRGLLPAPDFRGKDTSYGPEHLLRLQAIKHLQAERLPLEEIAARLASASPHDLEALARGDSPAPVPAPAPAPTPTPRAQRWERFTLAPGLELHLAEGADDHVRRLAHAILTQHSPEKEPDR